VELCNHSQCISSSPARARSSSRDQRPETRGGQCKVFPLRATGETSTRSSLSSSEGKSSSQGAVVDVGGENSMSLALFPGRWSSGKPLMRRAVIIETRTKH